MPLPLSKNQVRNLDKRLRDASTPAPEDLDLLAEVLTAYDEAVVVASDLMSGLGLPSSGRLKNTGTVLEKLRRDHSTNLHSIQDLAGLRVFVDDSGGRRRQDEVVALISTDFATRAGNQTSPGSCTVWAARLARSSSESGVRWPRGGSSRPWDWRTWWSGSKSWRRAGRHEGRQQSCGTSCGLS